MLVVIHPDREKASSQAAKIVADQIRRKPDSVLGLPTGNTPLGMYSELIRMHREEGVDLSRVTTFNLDEYFGLKREHPQSFFRYTHENFLDHVNIKIFLKHVPTTKQRSKIRAASTCRSSGSGELGISVSTSQRRA